MPSQPFVVALDVGASLTKIALAGSGGQLSAVHRLPTPLGDNRNGLVGWLAEQITAAAHGQPGQECLGFAIVVPGIIESAAGVVKAAPNLDWRNVPLRRQLIELTALSGVVGHDVRSGGLAEWRLGAGAGASNLLFLPLGTGIAGAAVVDGRMLDADGYAGEVGHVRVPTASSLACPCGQLGCLETVASASGVVRSYLQLGGVASPDLDAEVVARLARADDVAARAAFGLAADALTEALMLCLTLLGPELIVIGGGLSGAADLFLPQVRRAIADQVTFQRLPRIVPALLGADAGVIGAGLLGWEYVRRAGETP